MANEFMRFLLRTEELNNLAMIKRLITCSTVYSFDTESFSYQTSAFLKAFRRRPDPDGLRA